MNYVHKLIPVGMRVIALGDAEFGDVRVQKMLKTWRWKYVLRQRGRYLFKCKGHRSLQRLDRLVSQPGQQVWLESCRLTAKHLYRVNLLAYWQPGEEEPWL